MDYATGKLGTTAQKIGDLVSRENGVRFAITTKDNYQL